MLGIATRTKHSLRRRFIAGISIMLFPMAVLMLSSYYSIHSMVESIDNIVNESIKKLVFTKNTQHLILKTELPFHQFLVRGETGDRETFIRLGAEIDLAFEKVQVIPKMTTTEIDMLQTAQQAWQTAHKIGATLLTNGHVPESQVLLARMDEFSRHLERTSALLDEFGNIALSKIKEQRFQAKDTEWKSTSIIATIFSIGLIVAIFAAIVLTHSIIDPIRQLEYAVARFGEGDLSTRAQPNGNDELGHLASAFNAMAERFQKVQKELDYLSVHDSLTGLYDHTKFHEVMTLELQRAKRYKRHFSLLLVDIKNFRHVNETLGNLVGDSVLVSVAMQIDSTIRPTDIAARRGGDAFAIILSETDHLGAKETAGRIVKAIANHAINIGDGKTLHIDASIGIATYPIDADTETALLALADQALNHAKQTHVSTLVANHTDH